MSKLVHRKGANKSHVQFHTDAVPVVDPACDPLRTPVEDLRDDPRWNEAKLDILRRTMILAGAGFVRRAREGAGMTQTELANAIGVSQSRIAQLESAQAKNGRPPELMTLARVARACGRDIRLELV